MKNIIGFLISLSLVSVFLLPSQLAVSQSVNVVSINLFGSASSGWGFAQSSMTSPGPTITANLGDLVNLTLTSVDGLPHLFFVDYNSDGSPSSGEPASPTFTATINYQFSTTTAGTFTYFCEFHPGVMRGTFIVQQPTAGPIPPEITQYAKDWPLPNRDYSNTRFTADATVNSSNVGNLKLAWSFRIPGIGAYGGAASNPIIMGNNVYFQDLRANVFSLNLQDGHVNWQKTYNISAVVGPNGPAVSWGKVFVAKDLYTIAALNASTGEEMWATKISNVNTTGIDIQPSVYDNMVYVSTVPGTADVFYAPGGIGAIYALDQTSGSIVWNFSTVDSPNLWGHPEINSGGGCWYTPSIDLNSGVMFWGIANPAPFPGTQDWPSGSSRPGPDLYTDSMMALDHRTGTMKWFTQVLPHDLFDHDFQISPILASANISRKQQDIVIGAGKMGRVYAFNRDTGAILWQTSVGEHQNDTLDPLPPGTTRVLPGIFGGVETPMAYSVSDGILYVPVIDLFSDWTPTNLDFSTLDLTKGKGELVAIEVNTGNILWKKTFGSVNVGSATVVNDVVFTATYDGTIYGFKRTGEQLFSYKAPAGINGWPAVAGDTIVWPAGVGANASIIALRIAAAPTIVNLHLFGSASSGWGVTPGNMTSPGPTITVKKGDLVNLTLTSVDGLPHKFFVDYNGDASPSVGEPTSPEFQATINYQFNATTAGTFTYYCQFHPSIMHGVFTVQRSESLPTDLNGDGVVNILDISMVARAFDSRPGDSNWNPIADVDKNGAVNIVDISKVAKDFGKTADP